MAITIGEALLKLRADGAGLDGDLQGVRGRTEGWLGGVTGFFRNAMSNAAGFLMANLVQGAVNGVMSIGRTMISEALAAQEVTAQLNAVLESTGGVAGVTADMANELATSLSGVTRFSDDAILAGENMLLTFTNIGKDVFPETTQVMLDMSTAMGQDLKASALQLGKALNDPTQGMAALRRVGVSFSDAQIEMVKKMQESGDLIGAQTFLLEELKKEFGGSAEAAGKTFAGQLDILRNSLLNVAEGIGLSLIPVGQALIEKFIMPIVPLLVKAGEAFGAFIAAMASGEIGDAGYAIFEMFQALFGKDAGLQAEQFFYRVIELAQELSTWFQTILLPALQTFAAWFLTEAWPAIQLFVDQVMAQLIPGLQQLWTWIQQLAVIVLPLLAQAWAWISQNMNIVIPILGAIGAAILILSSPIAAVIAAVVLLATAWANNWGGIQEKTQTVINFIQPYVQAFLTAIQTFWAQNGEQIMATLAATWAWIQNAFSTAFAFLSGLVSSTLSTIQTWWAQHGDEVTARIQALFTSLQTAFNNGVTALKAIISAVTQWIQDNWQQHGDTLKAIAGRVWEGIQALFAAFKALFQGDFEAFGTNLRTLWTNMWQNLKDIVGIAIKEILEIDWLGLGADIIRGIAKGISSMNQFLADAALGAAKAALQAAKGFLGIESPSTVFRDQVGKQAMAGWAEGIRRNIGLPAAALERAASSSASAAQPVVNNWTIQAAYGYRDERSVTSEVRSLQMLRRSA